MKKIITLVAFGVVAMNAQAQQPIAGELGLNMANMSVKTGGTSESTNMKAGLGLGAITDVKITDNICFQPGLFYEMTGYKETVLGTDYSVNISTLTIPLNFQYNFGAATENHFFVGVGPYLGYNIGGNAKYGSNSTSLKIGSSKPDASGNGGDNIKAMDFGAGLNVGYMLANGWYARAHYQMGFSNLDPIGDADNSMKTSAIGITVGYYFTGHKAKKTSEKKGK